MIFEGFARMIMVMAPDRDWTWLRIVITNLKIIARPERDKRSHMVDARQLLALGVDLMEQALEMGDRYHAATCMRDGLIIAVLTSCPMRIGNLTAIEIGRHLLFDDDRYCLFFTEEETKTARPYQAELSPALNPYIDIWLRDHRRRLLARSDGVKTDRLWIDRWGGPMGDGPIRAQIEKRTKIAFGRHVWPHLARSIAATSFVDHDPAMVALVSELLGHSDQRTAHKHYILADAARAHASRADSVGGKEKRCFGSAEGASSCVKTMRNQLQSCTNVITLLALVGRTLSHWKFWVLVASRCCP